ncbi:PREDICTED: protein PALE CRESS, chloroplastic [Camelina sativa]|uniref:Protein PALE CRESS, chloroplastic n=1 Tax=Camelina sativa TaxID=90675 RepID=A0ABM0ZP72_CAMSA|nr:PREDICTED: protein PALE CRESS, chloroplastic [Camelina sativa]
MAATSLVLTCGSPLFSPRLVSEVKTLLSRESSISFSKISLLRLNSPGDKFIRRCSKEKDEVLLEGMPPEYYDDEWQARQREKTKELRRMQREEEEEEERKIEEYREIGMRLKEFPEEDLRKARKLVSSFIRAAEEVEERIEEAAEKGELDELVLMIIWNRLDLARRDDEKDAGRSLDLLYRRVETEILKRQASPAMKLLNDLLNMHDGFEDDAWLKDCRKRMAETFPREDPFSILMPPGFDIDMHQGPLRPPIETETDNTLLRVDFVREVDALLREVRVEEDADTGKKGEGLDPEAIALKFKQQEKQRTIRQVEAILDLALNLRW